MENIYTIPIEGTDEQRTFTSYLFYNSFLPRLHYYFKENNRDELLISLNEIKRISPLTIPNLLCAGIILKEYFGNPVKLYIPWDEKLVSYLKSNGFINLIDRFQLYKLNENVTHIMKTKDSLSDYCETFLIEKNISKDRIFNKYFIKYNKILYSIFNKNKIELNLELYKTIQDELLEIMVEICHNGANHSGSFCFANFQLNKRKKFEFSVSDNGIGLFESLKNKFLEKGNDKKPRFFLYDEFINLDSYKRNIYSIFEALFYRKDNKQDVYGLINVFHQVLNSERNGIIRFHTDNTQIVFTNYIYQKLFTGNKTDLELKKMIENFIESGKENIRIFDSKFKGVHVEIEIPINY